MGQITSTLFDGGYLIKVSKATATRNLSELLEKHKLSERTGVVGAVTIYDLFESYLHQSDYCKIELKFLKIKI